MGRAIIVAGVRGLGPLRRPFAELTGALWYASRPRAERLRTAQNHRRLNPTLDARAAKRLARRSFHEYVSMIVDSIWADALRDAEIMRRIHVIGRENLEVGERRGILTISHFGNWDMAASAALAMGLQMTTVMAQIISPALTDMVALSRHMKGLELYTPRQAARGLLRALRRGRFVALMADVPEAGPTVIVPYCGGDVRFSAVPARLAQATGAAILPVACWREADHWVLQIHPPVQVDPEDGEAAVMARVAQVLEPAVRRHPEQWYPFHDVYVDGNGRG
jgi:KDO2-lipid IV(A) lauroyltransferase